MSEVIQDVSPGSAAHNVGDVVVEVAPEELVDDDNDPTPETEGCSLVNKKNQTQCVRPVVQDADGR